MRRIALAAVAASILFTANRSEAQVTVTFDSFTFDRSTSLLVGTIAATECDSLSLCTVYLDATGAINFEPYLPPSPIQPGDPYYGLVTAWNTMLELLPPNPVLPPSPIKGLLTAIGLNGASAVVTYTMTTPTEGVLTSFTPFAQ
jgi:hypothetical protein